MHDVQLNITQPPTTFIYNTNLEKFSYNNYLAISRFILLSYVIGMDAQLGKHYNFFWLRWDDLGIRPPYLKWFYQVRKAVFYLSPFFILIRW